MNTEQEHDRKINIINIIIIAIAVIFILTIALVESSPIDVNVNILGLLAALGASVTFGATGTTMKLNSLKNVNVHASIFQFYTGMGGFIVSLPILFYLGLFYCFQFEYLSVIGSILISLIGYTSYFVVQSIGMSKGAPLWIGSSI
jgi:drug/metabolite transporter (DMT)-like permease